MSAAAKRKPAGSGSSESESLVGVEPSLPASERGRRTAAERKDEERVAALLGLPAEAPHLARALTHPSYANERRDVDDNQRLEFLGDAVLGFCASDVVYARQPHADEGTLTRLRAQLVNAETLAAWARANELAPALRLGRGAGAAGLRNSTNVLADAVEALIAAAYLDAGLEAARRVCSQIIEYQLSISNSRLGDPKSELQERVQALGGEPPRYEIAESGGPPHERWFKVRVQVGEQCVGLGEGRSKRLAERAAAENALASSHWLPDPGAATPPPEKTKRARRPRKKPNESGGVA
jgi:ribonuclease-3